MVVRLGVTHEAVFMLRLLGLVMLVMLFGCGSSLTSVPRSPSGLTRHMGDSTVALTVEIEGNVRAFCTGVWISRDQILTANHCAEAVARHNQKIDEDSEEEVDAVGTPVHYTLEHEVDSAGLDEPTGVHLSKVEAVDPDHDLAILKAQGNMIPGHDVASVADTMPALGESVHVVGHPRGMYFTYVDATVAAYRVHPEIGKVVQVNGTVWFGNSGGGVFDNSGHLVGIASRLAKMPQMSFFVHADSIKKFVRDLEEKKEQHDLQKALADKKTP